MKKEDLNLGGGSWYNRSDVPTRSFICGYCGAQVAPHRGYYAGPHADGSGGQFAWIYPCPNCDAPTYITRHGTQFPSPVPGNPIAHLPQDLDTLYDEARRSAGAGAYTAAVLVCRKMLMNIAVTEGASDGLKFVEYVKYLADNHFIPPKGLRWVDYIRQRGNEATHEIALMKQEDATALIDLIEMLLRYNYEISNKIPPLATP